ncbi:glutamine synthetase [Ruminiclostridium sufflavum DSM 19573]|uniref:Glutamine synthetase n=1 Tax=Ruminiclostridium sufflavum DSM 19573 TaxID=1121337 RepID=A0A318XLW6_9FIRM|nr:type I glutamate--ammonia ligase [Ruminiclostridium sufflavum]PYG86659.1 glutamine synthetase [Ruminiclostridium sufflavum DSM 19573]
MASKNDILKFIEQNDVKFVRLQFTDILGQLKNIAITEQQVEKALDEGVIFDASAIAGFSEVESSDMLLLPDMNTFAIIPWRPQHGKVARFICDIKNYDGSQFMGDPRYVLKKSEEKARKLGYTFNVGPECEFFLFQIDSEGRPTTKTHDAASYCDLAPMDLGENCRREICMVLEEMGFEIEALHHENAAGQHEVDFRYSDVMTAADRIMTFRMVVKTVAQRNGLHATFIPKPIFNTYGSGMHINMSLSKDGRNLFNTGDSGLDISDVAKMFGAGILKHIDGITAVANPLVNSYKRFVPGFEAPVHIAWSHMNRSPLLRVPAPKGEATRLELRSPDPSCNPYLTLALILEAGLDGLQKKMEIAPPVDVNTYSLTLEKEKELGIRRLPSNLSLAIEEMKRDSYIKDVLGEHIFSKYISAKEAEWAEYNNCVHQWEIDSYLTAY